MQTLKLEEAARFLSGGDRFLILTHRRPDGDTAGCAAALCLGLRSLGKAAWILENPQLTERYRPYHEGLTVPAPLPGVSCVSVDVASRDMLCRGAEELPVALLLDHHGSNPGFAPRGIIDPGAAACGELVLRLLLCLGVTLDKPMAEALYVALSTDTGCFRYSNTTARTLRAAAACLEAGAEIDPINHALFETVTLPRLRLNAYMAQHLEFLAGGKIALCPIPLETERETGVTEDDMEDVSNFPRNIRGVELAVTFRTVENGDTKLSLRASPAYDVAKLAMSLGGGGHKAAAGATVHAGQQEAKRRLLAVMEQQGIL